MLLVLLPLEKGVTEDFSQQPPAQELIAKDLHGNEWKFRHIFRGIRTSGNEEHGYYETNITFSAAFPANSEHNHQIISYATKPGSFGRSLDITKFSSYHELRSELGRLFGLEGQLEDPLRSGWQLVFVDRESDILLVGDDPWQEFVNSVWCIKILSPQEVQQMGKQRVDFLNSTCIKRLPNNNSCDDYIVNRQDSRNLSTGIASVEY
ncbi:hypothetical protein BHE74_00018664 [Ensete ventricosum]|nr:hypothetical protein BHE74_00018664 [Ensete ventricosum]